PRWSESWKSCTGLRRRWSPPTSRLARPSTARPRRRLRRYWASGWEEGFAGRLRLAPKRRLLGSLPHDFDRRTDRPCGAVPLQLVIREGGDNPFVIDAIEVRP